MKVKVREGAPSEPSGTQAVWALKLVKASILKRVQLKKKPFFFLENKSLQHNTDYFSFIILCLNNVLSSFKY